MFDLDLQSSFYGNIFKELVGDVPRISFFFKALEDSLGNTFYRVLFIFAGLKYLIKNESLTNIL